MSSQNYHPNKQNICEINLIDEETSITGGKSVTEIVQLLRTKTKLKNTKACNIKADEVIEIIDDEPAATSSLFPWRTKFTTSCREVASNQSMKNLDELVTKFLKYVQDSVTQCEKKPIRSYKLRMLMGTYLIFFHLIYCEIKKPLEHTSYLDKMSDILAQYIDVELKSSRRGREHPKKIAQRITTLLYLLLDKSTDHMLDSVLKSKYFTKKYSEICAPIMAKLLREHPGPMYETTYVRYLLSFKLWKNLAGKEQYSMINKDAVTKLKPPSDFTEKLKTGIFASVLPYVTKSEKHRLTHFFMTSPFNVKKKAEVFLKEGRKNQPSCDMDNVSFFSEDLHSPPVCCTESPDSGSEDVIMNIWSSVTNKESEPLIDLFNNSETLDEEENILDSFTKPKRREKSKKVCKDKSNRIVKTSLKKRRYLKNNSCVFVKNVFKTEPIKLLRTENFESLITQASSNEDSLLFPVKVEKSLKKDENTCLYLSTSPEQTKLPKPCAAIEPAQCKELEPDSQCKIVDVFPDQLVHKITLKSIAPVKTTEDTTRNRTKSSSSTTTGPSSAISGSPTVTKETSSEVADSSGICEEIKLETNTEDFFVVDQLYKEMKEDEPILEDQLVAHEVVISTEISQDDNCTSYLIMDGKTQEKIDHRDIMSVIGISEESTTFCQDSVILNSDTWKKGLEKQKIQTEAVSVMDTENIPLNINKPRATNCIKVQSLPENNQFLTSECNDSYVSLDRRVDSYSYNDEMLSRLISELNADEGSDEENRFHNQSQYAGGGKISAFREQIEEAKSDERDDYESLSPASRSDSQKSIVETSPGVVVVLQHGPVETTTQDYDQEVKSLQLLPVKGEIPAESGTLAEQKSIAFPPQLREVSVNLYMGEFNGFYCGKEKIYPKGMSEMGDDLLHFKTIDSDCKFYYLQQDLCNFYNSTSNILETDPVPFPPVSVVESPINGFARCCCSPCNSNFSNLNQNYGLLNSLRSKRVCQEIDRQRLVLKLYSELDQNKLEDEKLLKSIEETIPKQKNVSIFSEPFTSEIKETKSSVEKSNSEIHPPETGPEKLSAKPSTESSDHHETKSGYSNLPPKKRKAFSIDVSTDRENQNDTSEIQRTGENKKARINEKEHEREINETIVLPKDTSLKTNELIAEEGSTKPLIVTKECSVVIDKLFPVKKIKSIDGRYHVLQDNPNSESSDRTPRTSYSIPQEDTHSRRVKCHKHHKRSKEEKRLRKEQKRLKKLLKEDIAD